MGDLVTIRVVQTLQSENTGNVATDRNFKASSGIDALAGHISTSGVQNIFSANSSQSLSGKAQASSSSEPADQPYRESGRGAGEWPAGGGSGARHLYEQ